ncbi:MAG: 5-(carboxyamino)imidazole ribonucleotide synthase [Pseudomonadota bacterium]
MSDQRPYKKIGLIGGGQLGRMLGMAAARLGHKTIVLDPAKDCPAAQVCNEHIVAAYDDQQAFAGLHDCDVVTFEFENIGVAAIRALSGIVDVAPGPLALEMTQDRLTEKQFLADTGLPTAAYHAIDTAIQLETALKEFGGRGILKTRRFGYDGKGQVLFAGKIDDPSPQQALDQISNAPAILEAWVPFALEISVIVTRNASGQSVCFDPAQNLHKGGILHRSTVPAEISAQTRSDALERAIKLVEALNYVGTLGLEFFVLPDGSLLANEFAPRVHNSGHWTEAACTINQFEMHIRAITGWPLPTPVRHSDAMMENLIGDDVWNLKRLALDGQLLLHDYGKTDIRAGRKMGHFSKIMPKTA